MISDDRREDVVRTPTRTLVTACALSAALVAAGCGVTGDENADTGGKLVLQPVADQGPDPFTDSTATSTVTPSPITRTPRPAHSGRTGLQPLSGETPGLYGGTRGAGSCDVRRQIDQLTSDRAKARVFAQAAGIAQASIPAYLRGLTSVVLRADTRVTNHGFRDGMGTGYQSVLQAGTAVLVDHHGVPRVRCACGNPLAPPVDPHGTPGTSGRAWSGYRSSQVVVVAPTIRMITNITIINVVDNTWIERSIGHQGHHRDHAVRPPKPVAPTPHDSGPRGDVSGFPEDGSAPPSGGRTSPPESPTDCVTPTATTTAAPGTSDGRPARAPSDTPSTLPADCPTATATASPPTTEPGRTSAPPEPPGSTEPSDGPSPSGSRTQPGTSTGSPEEVGPQVVPDAPDAPDGAGLIPDAPDSTDAPVIPGASDRTNGSIFGSPTDVFNG
ncbi:DUF6777 domain-containing protein [Streptomyces sp. NBC_00299]|uniref:DUF6777 domain-containing protein n=1 Tax=Streptomyces sp. NBC_00299 TaxID=2975705 RepID=UPI002E29FC0F|nr:DUF6777 domain-containing protein [Streptomyces sp. NBC_00299]